MTIWLCQNAECFPNNPFLKERGPDGGWRAITYVEMLVKTNQLSNSLLVLDLKPQAPIVTLSHNSIDIALIQFALKDKKGQRVGWPK